jgi:acetoin:2,6-dichlorophenolindophenol oxidoreductase subunit beta
MSTAIQTSQVASMNSAAALNSALDCAMAADEKVILLGEDIADPIGGVFKITKGLSTKYGKRRVRATPISEQAIIGTAIGLALAGYKPVAEIMFFDFMTVAMDQVVNHAAKLRYMSGGATAAPLTIRTSVGGKRFGAQHAQSLEAWFMHVPGIKVVMPAGPCDAKGLLSSCIADSDPCLFIEHMNLAYGATEDVPVGEYYVPIGKAAVVRSGTDLTLITYGAMLEPVLAAARALDEQGISTDVIDLRSLVPLDFDTVLASVGATRRALIVHEATQFCGPGAEIACRIHEELFGELLAPALRVGAAFTPIPFSQALSNYPSLDSIVEAAHSLM